MHKTVKSETEKCLADYGKKEREKWVIAGWPGMSIIAIDMMQWTQGAEEAMKKGGIAGLEVFYEKLGKQVSKNKSIEKQRCIITNGYLKDDCCP